MILVPKAGLRDLLLFLSVRVADYITALLLYQCSKVLFLGRELNMSLVLALQTGNYSALVVREVVWFFMVVGGLRASLHSSRWVGKPVSRVLIEIFSCAFLLSLGISFCGVTENTLCIAYVLLGMKHPLEYGFGIDLS